MVSVALLAVTASQSRGYSAVNTILVVVVTLLLIAVTVFLSVKLGDRRVKPPPGATWTNLKPATKECSRASRTILGDARPHDQVVTRN